MNLTDTITRLVNEYIDNFDRFDSNAQIRINPAKLSATLINGSDMTAEIEDNDEAIEDAAAADGIANEDATDFQVSQNPDFYSIRQFLQTTPSGATIPSPSAIRSVADKYA